jgi:hypothetical protein
MARHLVRRHGWYVRIVFALMLLPLLRVSAVMAADPHGHSICDHIVVLDSNGKLQPWTGYDNVMRLSQNFIEHCPTTRTVFGNDPWYVVTSKLNPDGTYIKNQNCQGSNVYWASYSLNKYYAFSGDAAAIKPVRLMLDRILHYLTPATASWPHCPITQDNTPDGQYTDSYSEPDKMALVGSACINFYQFTGEQKYLDAAIGIANTLAQKVRPGDATHSPLPFRVNVGDGSVIAAYTSDMFAPVRLFGELMALGQTGGGTYQKAQKSVWDWVMNYPIKTNKWSNFYEDVGDLPDNLGQTVPMETARYILEHPAMDPNYKRDVPALLNWVKTRFGLPTVRYGAPSIREQDCCFFEMSNHTNRYAAVLAQWFGILTDANDAGAAAAREEARACFALSTYSAYNQYSTKGNAINYVGIGYANPWFVDCYFDYICHFLDGMKEMPELAPSDSDHILYSSSVVQSVSYKAGDISYRTFDHGGREMLRLTFTPSQVLADGKPLDRSQWTFGDYRGVSGVLMITCAGTTHIEVSGVPKRKRS